MQTRNNRPVMRWRPVNIDEEARQVSEAGDAHKALADANLKEEAEKAYKDMNKRYEKGERDAFLKDTALGIVLSKIAPAEHHADRWERQHKIYMQIDELNAKGRTLEYLSEAWVKNGKEIERLERSL